MGLKAFLYWKGIDFSRRIRLCSYGGALKQFSFPKEKRITSNKQFKAILACKKRFSNELLTLYVAKNDCGYSRFGVSVGKSYGKAVARNRLKRLLREVSRVTQDKIPVGVDYLLMPSAKMSRQTKAAAVMFEQLKTSFLSLVSDAAEKTGAN